MRFLFLSEWTAWRLGPGIGRGKGRAHRWAPFYKSYHGNGVTACQVFFAAGHAAFWCDVAEFTVAFIVEQAVPTKCGEKDIDAAVIIVIAHGGTHAVEGDVEAGAGSDILEVAFAVVAVKRASGSRSAEPRRTLADISKCRSARGTYFPWPFGEAVDEQ